MENNNGIEVVFNDDWTTRMYEGNIALLNAYRALDPKDPEYYDKLKILSGLHDKVENDYNNYVAVSTEGKRMELEATKAKDEKKLSLLGHGVAVAGIIATLVTFFVGEAGRNKRFDKASAYEEEHAYLKTSEKAAVREGLEPSRNGFFNLLKR